MREQNQVLVNAVRKLALAGEQAEFSVEEMIETEHRCQNRRSAGYDLLPLASSTGAKLHHYFTAKFPNI